jgi:AsmA protein
MHFHGVSIMRKLILAFTALFVLLLVAVIAVPFFIDANKYKPMVEEQAEKVLGRKLTLGKIDLSIWHGGLVIHHIAIADDLAFSHKPFLEAKSLSVGVALWPYISSREIIVKNITLESPDIRMISNTAGLWNFSTLGKSSAPAAARSGSSAPGAFTVQDLSIDKGKISVVTNGKEHIYDDVSVNVSNFTMDSRFPLTLSANTPGGGNVKLNGKVGPLNLKNIADSPADIEIKVKDFDIAQAGFLAAGSPLAGKLDYDGTIQSDGKKLTGEGKATFNKLKLTAGGAPTAVPLSIDYATEYSPEEQTGKITKGLIHAANSMAKLTGTYFVKGENIALDCRLVGDGIKVDDVEGLLPAFGVVMPSGSKVTGGTISTNLTIKGPVGAANIVGPVHISDSKVENFDLASRAKTLASLAGIKIGKDIILKTVSTDVVVAPDGVKTDNINVVSPGLGTVTGAGTVSKEGNLNYKMRAKLEASGTGGALMKVASGSSGEIPFSITGTTSNPTFVPDVVGTLKNTLINTGDKTQNLGNLVNGLFGKKKK